MIRYAAALGLLALASLFWAATIPQAWALGMIAGYVLTEMWRRRGEVVG